MSELKSLFRGIVVLIDDEVIQEDSEIIELAKQIEKEDCHVIKIKQLPTDGELDNLTEAAFFILDWNLYNIQAEANSSDDVPTVRLPQGLTKKHIQENIQFLKKIRKRRFAPIFIFTNEDIKDVESKLSENELFSGEPSDHIFVQSKANVISEGVFNILERWIRDHPSAYVLKRWEAAYINARNTFFLDFYSNSHLWPVVLWETYRQDNISEAAELTSLIGRNILSRLAPVPFDAAILASRSHIEAANGKIKPEEIHNVLEGERFVREARLQDGVSMGDVFEKEKKFYLNIRPECDCVPRNGKSVDNIDLYLIEGEIVLDDKFYDSYNEEYGIIIDRDTTATIFSMWEGITVRFRFNKLSIVKFSNWKDKRIGRLIPPYSTKLQQRFASFIQRIGLSRIPEKAVPTKKSSS